jgi:hypothetical protein
MKPIHSFFGALFITKDQFIASLTEMETMSNILEADVAITDYILIEQHHIVWLLSQYNCSFCYKVFGNHMMAFSFC